MVLSDDQQIIRVWDAFADAGFTYMSDVSTGARLGQ